MRFSFGQELRQEQKQVLSQRMIQSMEILQLSVQQLEERVEAELENNPLLEIADETEQHSGTETESSESDAAETRELQEERQENFHEHENEISVGQSPDSREDFQIADEFATLYSGTIDEEPNRSQNWLEEAGNRHAEMIANVPSRGETLAEHLLDQLSWYDLEPPLHEMIERIIYSLDAHGFFTEDVDEFLGAKATQEDRRLLEEGLEILRQLDPPGVGVRNVRESLLMQIDDLPQSDVLATLIKEHFDDIRYNRLPQIAKKTGYTMTMIQEAIATMRYLQPYPASGFKEEAAPPVTPDVILEKNESGGYEVHVEEGRIPHLRLSRYYRELMKQATTEKGTRDYIKQKSASAQWLIDSILQRRSTLQRVAQAIVDYQSDYFDIGPEAIKPLKMQQIADVVGMHVTTISRTCDEKWMLTPQGLIPLRRFFSGGIQSSEGDEEIAQDAVRLKLREIVDKEDKTAPLSDEELVKQLEAAGIRIARRTVVKYRQSMNIPSSRQRRVWEP